MEINFSRISGGERMKTNNSLQSISETPNKQNADINACFDCSDCLLSEFCRNNKLKEAKA